MKNYKRLYTDIVKMQSSVIEESLSDDSSRIFSNSYVYIADFEKWIAYLGNRNEVILYKTAIEEYANALYLMVCGLYRESYIALRFFVEHTLFGFFLSTNELNYRLWAVNKYDMKWSVITDEESGIFSEKFFTAYSPDLIEYNRQLLGICKGIYRELSEYTHGNLSTTKVLPSSLKFDKNVFNDICRKVQTIQYLVSFLFFARYKNILEYDVIVELEHPILDIIGHLPEVEAFFLQS